MGRPPGLRPRASWDCRNTTRCRRCLSSWPAAADALGWRTLASGPAVRGRTRGLSWLGVPTRLQVFVSGESRLRALRFTGLRLASELLPLTWQDVQFQRNQLTVQAAFTKTGETRNVPLNGRIRAVLLRLKSKNHSRYIFAKPNGRPYRLMDKLLGKLARMQGYQAQASLCIRFVIPLPHSWS